MKNMGRGFDTGGKETFRSGSGAVKGIAVQVNVRHETVLETIGYESVCNRERKGYGKEGKRQK